MESIDISLLELGGPVMWVLVVVSLFGFIVFIERALFLHKGQIRTSAFLDGIKNLVAKRRLAEAITVCEETPGPVVGVIKAALLHHADAEDRMRQAVQAAALVEIPILERRVGTLAAIARIAPLLGLLGTVLAMTTTFLQFRAGGAAAYPDFSGLMAGVGQAMITTLVGLMIAVMAHLAHHFLYGRVRALVHDMEFSGHDVMEFLLYHQPRAGEGTGDGEGLQPEPAREVPHEH